VLESFVRDDARVREAPAWRKPITTYNPDGKAYRPRSTGLGRPKHPQLPNTSAPAPTVTLRFSVHYLALSACPKYSTTRVDVCIHVEISGIAAQGC
jgi:hypothetical protein